ncbi:hypothetical protein PMAYCL1PPCAC_29588 [Pristionchus mayeri]|uniref:Uncharacterized protein n=1 Tax=Pristionchus mayeri TaxID=1317129 RepID=A0AAN5DA79_9BILA|nr:hypothetical protein PMAYCL1PPCAC_29588 [Pristionchus mayeri]
MIVLLLPFLLLPLLSHTKIQDSSVKVHGSVEDVRVSNIFALIKENDTWLDVLDIHPGTQNEFEKVPYESIDIEGCKWKDTLSHEDIHKSQRWRRRA